jgi:hypothetical protein
MGNTRRESVFHIAHGWRAATEASATLISGFIRPAVRAVPPGIARQLGYCHLSIVDELERPEVASRWTLTDTRLDISLAISGRDDHEIALELLVCLGQALWERLTDSQRKAYWLLLDDEISRGISGEIDEEALKQKSLLLSSRSSAVSRRRLELYGSASFGGTAAEYIHSLWHDVSVRTGPRFLPAKHLHRRLELLARWYPPGRGYRLFPPRLPNRGNGRSGIA